jgi:hypothetical protein
VEGRGAPRAETGFTIVEVVLALTILVIALVGSALLFENGIVVSGNTRARVKYLSPPYFLSPTQSAWGRISYTELKPTSAP